MDLYLSGGQTYLSVGQTYVCGRSTYLSVGRTYVCGGQTYLSVGQTCLWQTDVSLSSRHMSVADRRISLGQTYVCGRQTYLSVEQTYVCGRQTSLCRTDICLLRATFRVRKVQTFYRQGHTVTLPVEAPPFLGAARKPLFRTFCRQRRRRGGTFTGRVTL